MEDVILIIKSLENSVILIDWVSETVKHEIKSQEGGILGMLLETLVALMLGNILIGKGVMKAVKAVVRPGRGYNVIFSSAPSFKQYQDY